MSSFVVALVLGVGAGSYAWTKLSRYSGNADPKKAALSAAIIGLLAVFIFYSLLKWILHIG